MAYRSPNTSISTERPDSFSPHQQKSQYGEFDQWSVSEPRLWSSHSSIHPNSFGQKYVESRNINNIPITKAYQPNVKSQVESEIPVGDSAAAVVTKDSIATIQMEQDTAMSPNGWQPDDRSVYPSRFSMSPTTEILVQKSGSRNSNSGTTFTHNAKRVLMKNNVLPQRYKPHKQDVDNFGTDLASRPLSGLEFMPAYPNMTADRPASMFYDTASPQRSQLFSPESRREGLKRYSSQPQVQQSESLHDEKRYSSSDVSPTNDTYISTTKRHNINSPNLAEPEFANGLVEQSEPEPMVDMTDPEIAEICRPDFTHASRATRRNNLTGGIRIANSINQLPRHLEVDNETDKNDLPADRQPTTTYTHKVSPMVAEKDSTESSISAVRMQNLFDSAKHKEIPNSQDLSISNLSNERPKVCIVRAQQPSEISKSSRNKTQDTSLLSSSSSSDISRVHYRNNADTNDSHSEVTIDSLRVRSITPRNQTSRTSGTRKVASDIIVEKKEISHLALGPPLVSSVGPLVTDARNGVVQTQSPIWIAICSGSKYVSIYKLSDRTKLIELTTHLQGHESSVLNLLPLSPISPTTTDSKSKRDSDTYENSLGMLGVIQKNGNITVYDINIGRVYTHVRMGYPLTCAVTIPNSPNRRITNPEAILTINGSGFSNLCVWKNQAFSQLKGIDNSELKLEVLDLSTNIFSRVSEDGTPTDFKYCVCAQKPIKPGPNSESANVPKTDSSKNGFLLVTTSIINPKQPGVSVLRISTWILQSNKLQIHGCVDKVLSRQNECRLVDVNFVENGSAASLCICLTTEVLWLSLKSLDLVSTLRLPSCIQPVQFLSTMWPPATLSHVLNRGRLWIATTSNRLVELAAFESQRRRNMNGKGCLLMLHVAVTDASLSCLSCTSGETSTIVVGTTKGEVHITRVPQNCYGCMVTSCPIGSSTKDDLVHHVLRDHYLSTTDSPSLDDLRCRWNGCGFFLQQNGVSISFEALENHARQHIFQ